MTRDEFIRDQLERKGYVCPDNIFDNPLGFFMCDKDRCQSYGGNCVITGKGIYRGGKK